MATSVVLLPPRPSVVIVAFGVDALEAGDDDDLALVELLEDPLLVDRLDAGLGEGVVGDEADLPAGEADRLVALAPGSPSPSGRW